MDIHWEMWAARAFFCLFNLLFVSICRWNLCEHAYDVRNMIRYGRGKYAPQNTGRQPKFIVWLLYTDVRTIRRQDFALRLNMLVCILAALYGISELLLGWLPMSLGLRIVLSLCTVFFGICTFISYCISHKRDYGSAFILYKKNPGGKSQSTLFDLVILCVQLCIAGWYLNMY